MTEKEVIQDLISRYRMRLKSVYSNPSPYYALPIYEYSEIKQKVEQLEKLIK